MQQLIINMLGNEYAKNAFFRLHYFPSRKKKEIKLKVFGKLFPENRVHRVHSLQVANY
jgi:hypothetical protein